MSQMIAEVLALVGGAFMLIAGIGTLRLGSFASRVHAAAKASTVGLCSFLGAVAIQLPQTIPLVVVIVCAVLLTIPAGVQLLMRAVNTQDSHKE